MGMPSRWWGWALAVPLVVMGTGCTSVRMVQKDGCWVKQTERWIVGTKEELGPCRRPELALSSDPVIRAVQECVAQADYRWQARAMEAWRHGGVMPEPGPGEDGVLEGCLSGPLREALGENAALRAQLERTLEDRSMLRTQTDEDRLFLQGSHERLATALGEAANKPPGTATATAHSTSEGTAHVQGDLRASSEQSRRSTTGSVPDERAPTERAAPLELMRHAPEDQAASGAVIPVDAARPAAPVRDQRGEASDAPDPIDLWKRLEDQDREAVQTADATDVREATGGSGEAAVDLQGRLPARAAVGAQPGASASSTPREAPQAPATPPAGPPNKARHGGGPAEASGSVGAGEGGTSESGAGATGSTASKGTEGDDGCPITP